MGSEWAYYPLGELSDNFDSKRIPVKRADRNPGPFPYYGASGIIDYIDDHIFDGEYLLVAEDGENLRNRKTLIAFIADGKFWVNNHAHIIRGNGKANTKFLMYALSITDISGYITGTTVPKLNQESLSRIAIYAPPLVEQEKIVVFLDVLEQKIELNRRMNHTLEAMARAIFKSWFVDFDPVRAKLDGRDTGLLPEIETLFPDGFEDSELGKIPKGWRVGTLGQISEKPQYGYTASAQEENVGPKFIRIKDINKTPWIEWGTVPYCEIENEDFRKYKVSFGDVLIARMADPGHGILVEDDLEAVFASYLIRFKLKDRNFSRFIQFWLKSFVYWDIVHSRKTGTTRPSINAKELSRFPIIIPPLKLVIHFGKVASSLREQIVANVKENDTLGELRDTLLPKLMRGELRV